MPRAIEKSFPFEELHRIAALESWRKEVHRPLSHVHKWWATRLGTVFRAIVLGGLLDEDEDIWGRFYSKNDFQGPIVLDPFMGSGTTLYEALKLGCRVVGSDINPVAHFLVREAMRPVSSARLIDAFDRLEKRVKPALKPFYSSTYQGRDAELLYAFWVKLIDCPDCRGSSRLFSSWIFSANAYPARKPDSRCVCPACGEILIVQHKDTSATCSACSHAFNPQVGPARRSSYVCEHCRKEHPIAPTYRKTERPPEHQLYALMLLTDDGRKVYKKPDDVDVEAYESACRKLASSRVPYPREEIPPGENTDQARGYNYRFWHQMFNGRQLYALGTILREVMKEPDGDVRNQLLLLFSGILEFNNLFCSFKGEGTGAVRHLFNHHILKPERTPLENNPWGTDKSSGTFSTLFHRRLLNAREYAESPFEIRAIANGSKDKAEKVYGLDNPIQPIMATTPDDLLAGRAQALVRCGDSADLPLPDGSVDLVVTDPPYFDNVHYSELADFFHVWIRLANQDGQATTRSDREVQATSAEDFAERLGDVFAECSRVLKPDGILAFTFHHSREDAWRAVLKALRTAGFRAVATHPVKAEMSVATPKSQAKDPIDIDCIIVCRKGAQTRRAAYVGDWRASAMASVRRFNDSGAFLSRGDIRVIVMGEFLKAATVNESVSADTFTAAIEDLHSAQARKTRPHKADDQGVLFDLADTGS